MKSRNNENIRNEASEALAQKVLILWSYWQGISADKKIFSLQNGGAYPGACLKIHSRHLHVPLRGIFGSNSLNVARYAAFI